MLQLYLDRADLRNGQRVLDLGCGFGSFVLFAAPLFPHSHFTAVTNNDAQRLYIETQVNKRGIFNVHVITADINQLNLHTFPISGYPASHQHGFDRIISIEMFEQMKNYTALMQLCASLLRTGDSKLFVQMVVHREYPYHLEGDDRISNYFFAGATMASMDLLHLMCSPLNLAREWSINGTHYARTSRQWLDRLDSQWNSIQQIMISSVSSEGVAVGKERVGVLGVMRMWRALFMIMEECFNWNQGQEWFVQHYLFTKPSV